MLLHVTPTSRRQNTLCVERFLMHGQHETRKRKAVRFEFFEQFQTARTRNADVDQGQVGLRRPGKN